MKWKTLLNASANARKVLPKLAEEYFEAGRSAADGKKSPKKLHRFRIATKRFRYALELFGPLYDGTLERRLTSLRDLQDSLGKISDAQTILELVRGDKAFEARLQRVLKRRLKEFQQDWREFDSRGQFERWKEYLSGAPSRTPTRGRTAAAGRTAARSRKPAAGETSARAGMKDAV